MDKVKKERKKENVSVSENILASQEAHCSMEFDGC
jgi:hypothetical protein